MNMEPTIAVTRGDASSWETVSLSSILPAGAKNVRLRFINQSDFGFNSHFRETGQSEIAPFNLEDNRTGFDIVVPTDSYLSFDYYVEDSGEVDIYVVGYDAVSIPYTTVVSDGAATGWTSVGLGNYVFTDATEAIIQFVSQSDFNFDVHYRNNNSSEVAPLSLEAGQTSGLITLSLDDTKAFDYYVDGSGVVDIRLISYSPSKLYCTPDDVYNLKAGIDSTVISEVNVRRAIELTDSMLDEHYGKSFLDGTSVTEWLDIEDIDEDDEITTIFLEKRPVQSLTSLVSYNTSDEIAKTWATSDYWLDTKLGRLRLRTKEFSHQNRRVKVVYTYGYSSVPTNIRNLSATITAMTVLIIQMGGTYDDVTSYTLPSGVSIGVGEPYMNMRTAIDKLEKERDFILKSIGQLKQSVYII